ncbi:DAK2 domain-containing protein [Nocardia sp. NPDC024068]|uniref:DAK2 domain-containing protein n=1 Tax=Nocardia sp. NPDC024068 TaxID=3157197 RepID=UPI0033CD7D14
MLRWGHTCVAGLERRRAEIDALNVFPVPDSDTGTNLLSTMRAAVAEADRAGEPVAADRTAAALARGAVSGARGNSGIIVAQVLRGLAEATTGPVLAAAEYRAALLRAAALVRESLSEPIEGTILTVLDRAGAAGRSGDDLAAAARAGADAASAALDATRDQLDVLRDAGVVDAGARGLLVLLDAMVTVVTGEAPARPEYSAPVPAYPGARDAAADPRYEVMYRVTDTGTEPPADLRARLDRLGDSVVVAADGRGGWSVHVHCADAGAAVEAGLAMGGLADIRIEYLVEADPARSGTDSDTRGARGRPGGTCGVDRRRAARTAGDRPRRSSGRSAEPADRGVLAIAAGTGAAELFEAAGAVVLGAEPALRSADLLAAIRRLPHREVLVLPNGALPAQELVAVGAAARDAHRDVLLLPSTSMVQGLAALAVHDRSRIAVDDAFAMSEAAAATRWGALRRARGRALTMVGTCGPGDGLGLVGHDVVVIDGDTRTAGETLLDRMLGLGGELVTLLVGAEAPDGLADGLAHHIGEEFPGVEVTVYTGGQRGDLIQIGVE